MSAGVPSVDQIKVDTVPGDDDFQLVAAPSMSTLATFCASWPVTTRRIGGCSCGTAFIGGTRRGGVRVTPAMLTELTNPIEHVLAMDRPPEFPGCADDSPTSDGPHPIAAVVGRKTCVAGRRAMSRRGQPLLEPFR